VSESTSELQLNLWLEIASVCLPGEMATVAEWELPWAKLRRRKLASEKTCRADVACENVVISKKKTDKVYLDKGRTSRDRTLRLL
jgi:hypothetical protein